MAGRHTYNSYVSTADDPFMARVRAFRNDDTSELSPEDQLTADQIKAAEKLAMAEDRKEQNRKVTSDYADVFIAAHPEFNDTQANGELMHHELNRMFGATAHTLDNFEAAYESLRASNFLSLNKVEVEKQRKAAAKLRAAEIKKQDEQPTEAEMYAMPLDEILRRDAIENAKRMQRRGEEGGF